MYGFTLMSNSTQDGNSDNALETIYCMHCGTGASVDDYACDRCGERVYVPDSSRVPPLGFTSCQECSAVNEAHASYCAVCAIEIDQSSRISPDGVEGAQQERDGSLGSRSGRDDARSDGGRGRGYRIGTGSFRPSQWGLPRRDRPSRDEDDNIPQEIQRWNWSAFILGPIWGVVHGLWWTILGFLALMPLPLPVPVRIIVLFGVMIILGLKGNEMAWRARQWDSAEKFLAVQQRWATWSIVFAIGVLVAFILFLLGQG